jgi:hypothetical protein
MWQFATPLKGETFGKEKIPLGFTDVEPLDGEAENGTALAPRTSWSMVE